MSDSAEKPYPSQGIFDRKVKSVEALQYDGSKARAYEILAWVHRCAGRGMLSDGSGEQGPDLLYIDGGVGPVPDQGWVVRKGTQFSYLHDQDFRDKYHPAI